MEATFVWLVNRVNTWVGKFSTFRIQAINGLTPALSATIAYVSSLERGGENDPGKEQELFGLWFQASSQVVHYDRELSKRCLEKSEYWLRPQLYNSAKIAELNISLKSMRAALEKIKHK